jgi:hypothetical protein
MAREGVDEEGHGLPVAGNVDAGVPGLLEDEPLDDGEQDPGEAVGGYVRRKVARGLGRRDEVAGNGLLIGSCPDAGAEPVVDQSVGPLWMLTRRCCSAGSASQSR